ncbi:uncharacterized protein LOC126891348 [Diabrotica virgifera virgifera]|uniref:MULE transposase domain-containing protein n=2 Tax=Diabrotica virgifera virgifera TaxID=50390 RepID=A0ABM5L220_DIAVI|nr:uncharacterized protein LOC126891348 [Diabrotica virgifera virgifera]
MTNNSNIVTSFFDIVEAEGGKADELFDALKKALVDKNIPISNLVAFYSDITNVMAVSNIKTKFVFDDPIYELLSVIELRQAVVNKSLNPIGDRFPVLTGHIKLQELDNELQQHALLDYNIHKMESLPSTSKEKRWSRPLTEDELLDLLMKDDDSQILRLSDADDANSIADLNDVSSEFGDDIQDIEETIFDGLIQEQKSTERELTEGEDYQVVFYPTHIGHSRNIGRVPLPDRNRTELAGRLTEGVPIQRILEDIRNSADTSSIERLHLTEKKDLHNIKRDFRISYSTKLHENDAISVRLWVDSMKGTPYNPVLHFKEEGQQGSLNDKDFILIIMNAFQQEQLIQYGSDKICINGTHGLNNYDFQLYTIVVVDRYGSGIPVAFCFSNRSDSALFEFFFNKIKDKVGNIQTQTFMSDDAPAFYNAWRHIMGPAEHQLLCSWHVQRNFFQNLNKITGDNSKEKRSLVFKTLKVLQSETNEQKFSVGLKKFVDDLNSDPDTSSFGNYFSKYYVGRTQTWAYCYRKSLGINTNMYLEALHKKIKYTYLEGKQCRRLYFVVAFL